VHPVDDFNLKNKPLSVALLRLLSTEFKAKGDSFKALIRGICASDAYQRRCDGPDQILKVTFAQGVVRPLSAEQIVNSLETATRGRATFDTARAQALAERMAREDASISEVTEVRPDARALLWLSNSEEIWSLLRESSVLAGIRKQGDGQVRAMFLAALSREPDAEETKRLEAFLQGRGPDGLADAYWTLLNSAEFLTRH
jgi:hypothetical protein